MPYSLMIFCANADQTECAYHINRSTACRSHVWLTWPKWGWSGGAMVLGKLPVPGHPTVWIKVGQGPTALAVGAGVACLDIFTLIYPFSLLSSSLWETARYRLKYCLKGPLHPKQPINQPHGPNSHSNLSPQHTRCVKEYNSFCHSGH